MTGFLRVEGTKIVSDDGKPVVLRGAATGGHLNMENFITGYPGHETQHKEAMLKFMGQEKYDFFWDRFYDYFWTDKDSEFYAACNLNCLRIPFNHRHFLDDNDLTKVNPNGFKLLDRVVDSCARFGIYTVLDLHTAPCGQNQDWHSDNATHAAQFWDYGHLQDTIINLWKHIAAHYKENPWVAGYNPLNEPADPKHTRLIDFYTRIEKEIRSVDDKHILFLDGNTYAADFNHFPAKPFPNSVYSIHDYSKFGFPACEERYTSAETQKAKLLASYERKISHMKQVGVPVWNGEWGPVYSSAMRHDTDIEATNASRYLVLRDQLEIYKKGDPSGDNTPISWSIWLYKDIGYQGLTFVSPDSKWYRHLQPWLVKKQSLGLDRWGRNADPEIEKIYTAVKDHFEAAIPPEHRESLYPPTWRTRDWVDRVLRDILLSEYLASEFAEYFRDLSFEELDELAGSFKFENVEHRDELIQHLKNWI
ncbi:glycoside hydrolase family 5 protein [Aspergillus steynii IBT 23096]|uniref:Glycoside hydrolase family 5 protein n=1 Tax=Aspergillus steynii IBT 23096 TaxID=1392250 RepID=A0A2I2GF45_9EURO|nr:glycoside hydrolase family 5 protein [Aspergillus steynii IBT 23096]PLB51505.1 glycoside hydrolase family 5 protein [Aspergillus steynii IBT 23096]